MHSRWARAVSVSVAGAFALGSAPHAAAEPDDPRLQVLDTNAFVTGVLTDLDRFGFTHGANEDACALPAQDYCAADSLQQPDADRTFVFAAAEHFTTHTHELLADHVRRRVGLPRVAG